MQIILFLHQVNYAAITPKSCLQLYFPYAPPVRVAPENPSVVSGKGLWKFLLNSAGAS